MERFYPDFEFNPDRSFMHIRDGVARFEEVRAELIVVEGDAQEANDTLDGWAGDPDRTVIDGGSIETGSVTAAQLSGLTIEVGKYIESSNYSAGSSGWRIDGNGDAELNSVTVRGVLETEFESFGGVTSRIVANGATIQFQRSGSTDGYLFNYFGDGVVMSTHTDPGIGASVAVDYPHVRISTSSASTGHVLVDSVFGDLVINGNAVTAQPVYDNTSVGSANVVVASDGELLRSTSSSRYKHDIAPYDGGSTVLSLTPSFFVGNGETVRRLGLIAEDVAAVLPIAAIFDEDGLPDAVDWNAIVAALLAEVQGLSEQVDALSAQVDSHGHQ